jgi:hypothetical protein
MKHIYLIIRRHISNPIPSSYQNSDKLMNKGIHKYLSMNSEVLGIGSFPQKVKVKFTLVQALRLCTESYGP